MTPTADPSERKNFAFLNLLRASAVLLVLWDHLGAVWPERNSMYWWPRQFLQTWVNEPLAIIQDFGFLGVVTFFIISGFIITHAAQRETRFEFAIKRILRIYPPLIASILTVIVITVLRDGELLSWKKYVISFTLLNYMQSPQYVVNGVAWTLVIEMLFYAAVFILMSQLKRRPDIGVTVLITFIWLVISRARSFGASFFLLAASFAYLPYLVQGQLIYLRWAKKITNSSYAVLAFATYAVTIYGIQTIHTNYLPVDNSYMISFIYALFVFLISLFLEDSIRLPRVVSFTSDISYSLYLYHGIVGFLVLDLTVSKINLTLSIGAALTTAFAVAYASYRFIERPFQKLARHIITRTYRRHHLRVPISS